MNFWPYEKVTYETNLSKRDALRLLVENLEVHRFGLTKDGKSKLFRGQVDGYSFKVSRMPRFRNHALLPVVIGQIEESGTGSVIRTKMRFHLLAMVFELFWVGMVCLFGAIGGALSINQSQTAGLITVAMLVFGYVIMVGTFNYESWKMQVCFRKLFDAKVRSE
ncbi:MAG: hypothetical protein IPK50_14455 [Fibrobacterota bacterium]|nr:hypothetical protein [Fibrobacterota bacterium]QQS03498.1 MAG: hypothetical protein IPK50_14455 [Fibrobacterota bacterium]